MNFCSILFEKSQDGIQKETAEQPPFFTDLNLDQIINAITAGKDEYNLKPFFYSPLRDVETIQYRYAIMQDLENEALLEYIKAFAQKMSIVRRYLALVEKLDFKNHREGWFLEAVDVYCEAITSLAHGLTLQNVRSRGFLAFSAYVTNYASSHSFQLLIAETNKLKADLSTIRYCVVIKDLTVRVRKYESETDYSVEVEKTFGKFKQAEAKDYRKKLYEGSGTSHVEAQILDCVAKLYPRIFADLDRFCTQHSYFMNETIRLFDREIQFYVAYLEHIARIKRTGLKFCYPQITTTGKEVYANETYDAALAYKLVKEDLPVVCNDFFLQNEERIIVVSGPNQSGKTTFARTFGQLHYLSTIGCSVPGREARLFLHDRLFTHFDREEDIKNLRGKLQDDLVRIHAILNQATSNSVLVLNEIFSSTTLKDAVFLNRKIMERITQLDLLCVWVTFIDELASFNEKTISMVSTVNPENPAERTYKLIRKPADGLAYARSIVEKHRLTYECIKERI
jgi:DNA mismatch repair ATPase MutS